jgi:hypothetical protein
MLTTIIIVGVFVACFAVILLMAKNNPNRPKWKQAAETLGMTYDGAEGIGKLHASGTVDGLPVVLALDARGTAEFRRVWTQARVTAGLTDQVFIDSGVERNPILRLEKALAEQVTIGDAAFDDVFRVQGDPVHVRRLCDETSRAAMLEAADYARVRIQEGDVIIEHLDLQADPDLLVKTVRMAVALAQTLQQTQVR